MNFSLARNQFYQAIRQPDASLDLGRAALYLAQEEYPDLDPEAYIRTLDRMAAEVEARLPAEQYPLRIINGINDYLYKDLGFVGNTTNYYDPRNSYFNEVIDRRTGIPITLSLLYLEIAKRIDFPMVGIGMPGHFLIRPVVGDMQVFVDPFHQGEVLFLEDCQDRLTQIYGGPVEVKPEFFAALDGRHFLRRMLTNLKMIYLNAQDIPRTLAAVERILLLFPDAPEELRDRGLLYYQQGRWTEAYEDLTRYLVNAPTTEEAIALRQILKRIEGEE